jgi:hypothetical protein
MEITSQLAGLEDEVKLLKGEIKSVLKEIRAAVLNSDNPFTPSASSRAPVSAAPVPAPEPAPAPAAEPPPAPKPDASEHAPAGHPAEPAAPVRPPEPIPLRSEQPPRQDPVEGGTDLLTIASLLGWAEDAITSLGTRRFRLMLELAYAAELLSPEVRDVLRDVAELWQSDREPERPAGVNECLLQLRQLEAILNGERVTRIPRRRLRKRAT